MTTSIRRGRFCLGAFSTPDSRSTRTDGVYTDHNTEIFCRDQCFSS